MKPGEIRFVSGGSVGTGAARARSLDACAVELPRSAQGGGGRHRHRPTGRPLCLRKLAPPGPSSCPGRNLNLKLQSRQY
ncbi:hypothetical protein P7K49_024425 [Saguinus oedipus]|uniref:Uncharacterized protein n=1 Tax=Saguinus oedipus TaxID=9490 RepID=A0ABQ9UPH3_SAGOE|nr:hypothetical protein P7K49_024425 [Saguinus oedipus]